MRAVCCIVTSAVPACWLENSPSEVRYHKLQEGGGETAVVDESSGD